MVLAADPWTDILTWLQTVIVPNWGELINMLPFFFVLGVLGPLMTLIVLMNLWYLLHRRRGHVRRFEPQPVAATRDAAGVAVYPPNVPFCEGHELLFPPRETACTIDGDELTVKCPVDGTSRTASEHVCRVCGTEYNLGAAATALSIRNSSQPPRGGAAVA